MSSKKHAKKRNVGLLYEFLVRTISRSLVEGDQKTSSKALKIIKRHFKPGTELYKEFRLINSLIKTSVSSESVAASIMQEAKLAARAFNESDLDRQKSLLIRDINYMINDENFYDQPVNEYRTIATIQTLINDWRTPDCDLERLASYEDQLVTWLTTKKEQIVEQQMSEETPGTSRLLMKVMMKKLNEKYSVMLNDEQRALIRAYAFSTANDDVNSIKLKLVETRDRLLGSIENFGQHNPENAYINKKLAEAKSQLIAENLETVDDATVTRFMLYTKLAGELEEGDND